VETETYILFDMKQADMNEKSRSIIQIKRLCAGMNPFSGMDGSVTLSIYALIHSILLIVGCRTPEFF